MSEDSILKRNWVKGSAVLATAALSLVLAAPVQAAPLAKVKSATQGATENVVEVTFGAFAGACRAGSGRAAGEGQERNPGRDRECGGGDVPGRRWCRRKVSHHVHRGRRFPL